MILTQANDTCRGDRTASRVVETHDWESDLEFWCNEEDTGRRWCGKGLNTGTKSSSRSIDLNDAQAQQAARKRKASCTVLFPKTPYWKIIYAMLVIGFVTTPTSMPGRTSCLERF
jgi:hypothetical protein